MVEVVEVGVAVEVVVEVAGPGFLLADLHPVDQVAHGFHQVDHQAVHQVDHQAVILHQVDHQVVVHPHITHHLEAGMPRGQEDSKCTGQS